MILSILQGCRDIGSSDENRTMFVALLGVFGVIGTVIESCRRECVASDGARILTNTFDCLGGEGRGAHTTAAN